MSAGSTGKVLYFACATLAALCQISGFVSSGQGEWKAAGVGLAVLWLLAWKYSPKGLGTISLVLTVGLAVTGVILDSSGWLMICSAAFGLAAWDLLLLEAAMKDNPDDAEGRAYCEYHLKTSGIAVCSGLVLALAGRLVTLQIPFMVMLGIVALTVFGFSQAWRYFTSKTVKNPKI